MEELREITDHSVFTYQNEVLVELRGQTADGGFSAITYSFEPSADTPNKVQPRGPIDDVDDETIREILDEAGYELVTSETSG